MKKRFLAFLLIISMIIPLLIMSVTAAPQKTNGYAEAGNTYGAVASAIVTKLNGNQNGLKITVRIDGNIVADTYVLINKNSAGEFAVGNYKVYVSTYGNDKIDYCFITYAPEPPCKHVWTAIVTATCLDDGISKEVCGLCGGEQNEKFLEAVGHDFNVFVKTAPPTSKEEGYTVYKCVRCDETENRDFTPVLPGEMRDITGIQFVGEMGLGWNLGNALDSAGYPYGSERNLLGLDEMSWGSPIITESMIGAVANAGFKTLRIPITWETKIGPAPDYIITDVWMNRVEEVVNYGLANDMTVIINIHHDGWISLSNNSGAEKTAANAQFIAVWTQIANRFKNYGDKLVFESLNEPREYGASNEWSGGSANGRNYLNELNQLMVTTVRATGGNNEKRFIMVPTYAAGTNTTSMQGFIRPNDPTDPDYLMKRIILSAHAYEPGGLSAGDIRWQGAASQNAVNNIFTGANRVNATAERNGGMPVVMGEFAWINNDNLAAREIFSQYYVYAADQHGYACIWWDGMNAAANTEESTGLLIRDSGNPAIAFPSIVEAMIKGLAGDDGLSSGNGVRIDPSQKTLRLALSNTLQLRHYVYPLSASQSVSWSSSNTEIAAVNTSGIVTAVGQGTAVITATANGQSADCVITVKSDTTTRYNRLYDFDFDGLDGIKQGDTDNTTNSYSVEWLGDGWESSALKISDIKKTANPAQTGVYDWTSVSIFTPAANAPLIRRSNYLSFDFLIKVSDTAPGFNFIGTVLKTGASFPGDDGWKGWWDERYDNIGSEMTTIIINGEEYYYVAFKTFVGDHIQYIGTSTAVTICFILENFYNTADIYIDNILFTGGINDADYPEFPEIAEMDIVVSSVSIKGPDAAKTHVQNGNLYIAQGASMPLTAVISPENATNKNVYSWLSSNAGVSVDRFTGEITGVTASNTARNITVRTVNMDRVSPNFGVIVARPVSAVAFSDAALNIEVGKEAILTPIVTTAGSGSTTAVTTVFWTSSNESAATVDENGKVTAVSSGTAVITATSKADWKKSAECAVTVAEPSEQKPANFKVEGSKILDLDGNELLLKGVNINGPGWCFSRGTMQDVSLIVDVWKFNSVRLCAATKWDSWAKNYNNNATDNFDTIIKAFTEKGIVVIIENHDYTGIWPTNEPQRLNSSDVAPPLSDHIAWWVDLAERFGDNPYVWFNIMNEPGSGCDQQQAEKWFDVHDQVIAAVRAAGTDNIIVCDEYDYGQGGGYMDRGTGWCSAVIRKGPALSAKYDNLVFSLHPYGWTDGKSRFDAYLNDAKELGLCVIFGEYGVATNSLAGSNATYNMFNAAIEHNIGRMYWAWDDSGLPMCNSGQNRGWSINRTNGTKPTNLTWAGGLVWDDNHGTLTAPVPMYNLPPAVLTNGSFNSNLNSWSNWGNFTRVTDTATSWNGTSYAQIGAGSGGFGQDFTVSPNTTYRLSAAAYGVADLGLKYIYKNENMRDGAEFEYHNFINFKHPDEWKEDFITFTTPEDLYATGGTVFIWKNDGPAFRIDDIELIEVIVSDIAIKTMPAKLTYEIGESFDWSGLSLEVNYSGRASDILAVKGIRPVDQNNDGVVEISGFDSSAAGMQTVTVLYNKKTVTFDVTIGENGGGSEKPPENIRDGNIKAVLESGFSLVNVTVDISQLPNGYDDWGQRGINVADFNGPGSGDLPKIYTVNEDGTLGAQIGLGNAESVENGITQITNNKLSFYVDNSVQNRIEFRLRTGDWWQFSRQAILDVSDYQGKIYNITAVLSPDNASLEFVM